MERATRRLSGSTARGQALPLFLDRLVPAWLAQTRLASMPRLLAHLKAHREPLRRQEMSVQK
jgi:hypothetical protein